MSLVHRIHRPLAACMVVVLLTGMCLPLVQHVCAMAKRPMTHEGPCARHAHTKSPVHHSTHGHHTMAEGEEPPAEACAHEEAQRALPDDCCVIKAAQGISTKGRTPPLPPQAAAVLLVAVPFLAVVAGGPAQGGSVLDTGPPRAPACPLHILHTSLLN